MFKYLLLIGTTATIGFIAWRTLNEVSSPPPSPAPVVTEKKIELLEEPMDATTTQTISVAPQEIKKELIKVNVQDVPSETIQEITKEIPKQVTKVAPKENTLKSAALHDAFAKILSKDKPQRRPARKRLTIDELIDLNLRTGSTRMTGAERKLVIRKIKIDIKNLERQYADADTADENKIELKISHRREQLENFETIEAQFPGVNFEN